MPYDKKIDSAQLDGALSATADAIRRKTGGSELIPWDADQGFKAAVEGIAAGGGGDTEAAYNEGFVDGERAAWSANQLGGARTNYGYAYFESDPNTPVYTDETYKPVHDMHPTAISYMFRGTGIVDLPAVFARQGIVFDTSNCTALNNAFAYSRFLKHIGELDTTSASDLADTFKSDSIVTIDKIKLKEDGTQKFTRSFDDSRRLANITFEGVIGTDINFSVCPLSKASFINIFEHFSTTASFTATFNKTAKEANFTADEWAALVGTRPNVTIVLK